MARHTIPSLSELWKRHEALYTSIFTMALQKLSENKHAIAGKDEDGISESLCPILTDVCFNESKKLHSEIRTPDWERPIQPKINSELKGGKVRKRPDFTCNLINPFADDPAEHEISFHVECKRLGFPTSKSWPLNENYVLNGIKRFDDTDHEYGKWAFSGMMVGYVINMSPESILDEVNNHQKRHCSDNPAIKYILKDKDIWQYRQNLKRKNVRPKEFKLLHLWVNL